MTSNDNDAAAAASAGEHAEDEAEDGLGYVPPAPKSVDEIAKLDQDDEALVKYKKALLGEAATGQPSSGELEVKVLKMTFISEGRGDIVFDLTQGPIKLKEDSNIVIKEGCVYRLKFTFKVANQIVSGLKFQQNVTRKGISVAKIGLMLGSFGPREEPHEFITPNEDAPNGLLAKGKYNAKCKFIDDDKKPHLEWEWTFNIKKDWIGD